MTDTLTKVVVDCSTGEQTILPLTADEIASLELSRQEAEARKAEEDAADAACNFVQSIINAKGAVIMRRGSGRQRCAGGRAQA